MLVLLALLSGLAFSARECVQSETVDVACDLVQKWIDDASDIELAGGELTCAHIDDRLIDGLSIVPEDGTCTLDWPTPDHLREYSQMRLQQIASGAKAKGIEMGRQEIIDRISRVVHCEIPIRCLPICPVPYFNYIVPQCVNKCELDEACAKIQSWIDDASDLDPSQLGCSTVDCRLTEGLSVMGENNGCYLDFPSADHLRRLRCSGLRFKEMHKAEGIALRKDEILGRISTVLNCDIPVPCVSICDTSDAAAVPDSDDEAVISVVPAPAPVFNSPPVDQPQVIAVPVQTQQSQPQVIAVPVQTQQIAVVAADTP